MSDIATLVRVGRLYYEHGETQERIASLLGVTRPQVSKLLKEARTKGVVEIRIIDREEAVSPIAAELHRRFGLQDVRLAPTVEGHEGAGRHRLGIIAAEVLRSVVRDGQVVGIGAGSGVSAIGEALERSATPVDATVVPLCGGFWLSAAGPEPFRRVADSLGATARALLAPGLLESAATRDALWADAGIRAIRDLWDRLDVAVFGIGGPAWSEAAVGPEILREIEAGRAVGEVLIAPYDIGGRFVADGLRARTIAFDARSLPRVPITIGVAEGPAKVAPILGALRAGLAKTLVTDVRTAEAVLALDAGAAA